MPPPFATKQTKMSPSTSVSDVTDISFIVRMRCICVFLLIDAFTSNISFMEFNLSHKSYGEDIRVWLKVNRVAGALAT